MKRKTRKLLQLLFSISLVAFLAVCLAPTVAAHVATPGNGSAGHYLLTNISDTGNETQSQYRVIIAPGTSANITKSWSVSNSFGTTVGITNDVVSAQLSYNVTLSTDVSETCSANVNTTNQDQVLEWQAIFINHTYDIYWHDNFTAQDTYQGNGWAKEYIGPKCALY